MDDHSISELEAGQPLRLTGRRTSHFTRVAAMFAHEIGVAFELDVVDDLTSSDAAAFGGHPALKIPTLHVGGAALFGTENICRKLAKLAGRADDPRLVLPERVADDLLRNAQEIVWNAMAMQVQLRLGVAIARLPADNVYFVKLRTGLAGALGWLDEHIEQALARLPTLRDLSVFEVTLYCLIEHIAFFPTVALEPYERLREFAATFGERESARQTAYPLESSGAREQRTLPHVVPRRNQQPVSVIEYRAASAGDALELATLHAESWRRSYRGVFRDAFLDGDLKGDRLRVWTQRVTSSSSAQRIVVASEEGRVRGFVCAFAQADPGWGVFVDNLHVAASCQRAGVGTSLLHAVARWASLERPDSRPYLWVLAPNTRAQRFYARRGASECDAIVLENPGGGTATYLRYAWTDPASMVDATG